MPRRKLTLSEQLRGVRAALRNRKTPKQLRDGLRKREAQLVRLLAGQPETAGGAS